MAEKSTGALQSTFVQSVDYDIDDDEIEKRLEEKGYYRLRLIEDELPYYRFSGCRNGKHYTLLVNGWGRVVKRDYKGECQGVYVNAPFARIEIDKDVRIRVPFVDIWIDR